MTDRPTPAAIETALRVLRELESDVARNGRFTRAGVVQLNRTMGFGRSPDSAATAAALRSFIAWVENLTREST